MSPLAVSVIVFACVLGGGLLGMVIRKVLPDDHLSTDTKDIVKLVVGLIGTMAALVLGLLIASAKSSYDVRSGEVTQMSANVVLLDRVMAHYGPETKDARESLRGSGISAIDRILPDDRSRGAQVTPTTGAESFNDKILTLSPKSDAQRALQAQALALSISLGQSRWLLAAQGSSIPTPFLIVLILWLTLILASFGLFAPRNTMVIFALFVCALSLSSAIYLILELDQPFQGLLRISSTAARGAARWAIGA
jgi:hypothetical protein